MKSHLPNRDQRRQGITNDRQFHRLVELGRQTTQLERQRRNLTPIDEPRQSAVSQDRHRESLVFAVAFANGSDTADSIDVSLRTGDDDRTSNQRSQI